MAIYYTGPGGNDANNGTTWALRTATIQAGIDLFSGGGTDRLYVAPGRYPEVAVPGVAGASKASPHEVIADKSGLNTSSEPGRVITQGADASDYGVPVRTHIIDHTESWGNRSNWTWRGFDLYNSTGMAIDISGQQGIALEDMQIFDCYAGIKMGYNGAAIGVRVSDVYIEGALGNCIAIDAADAGNNDTGIIIERIKLVGSRNNGIWIYNVFGVTIRAFEITGMAATGIAVNDWGSGNPLVYVQDGIIKAGYTGISANNTAAVDEDNVSIYHCQTARSNVTASAVKPTARANPRAYERTQRWYDMGRGLDYEMSTIAHITLDGSATQDEVGMALPADGKGSRGATQGEPWVWDYSIKRSGSRSKKITHPGKAFGATYEVEASVSKTISVYLRRGADVPLGESPQMVIYDVDGTEITTVAQAGAAQNFNEVTHTWTPTYSGMVEVCVTAA